MLEDQFHFQLLIILFFKIKAIQGCKVVLRALCTADLTGFTFFANVPNAPKESYNPSDWGL